MLPYNAQGATTTQAISLGVHCISDAFPEAMLLMEVLPSLLAAPRLPAPGLCAHAGAGLPGTPQTPPPSPVVFVMVSALLLHACWSWATGDSPDPSAVAIVFVIVGMLSCEDVPHDWRECQ